MKESKVSIIVPIYNLEKYIRTCVISIINQTYKNLEIILIDDGSSDNSLQICNELSKQDSRIIVKHQNNGGVSSARNLGLEIVSGEYLTFIDGDDYIEKNYIEELVNMIKSNNCDLSVCGFKTIIEKKESAIGGLNCKKITKKKTMSLLSKRKIKFSVCAKLFKTKLVKGIKFNTNYKIGEDHLFLYEYIKKIDSSYINEDKKLYVYYRREDSAMGLKKYNYNNVDGICVWNDIINDYDEDKNIKNVIKINFMLTILRLIKELINYNFEDKEELIFLKKELFKYKINPLFKFSLKEYIFYELIKHNKEQFIKKIL